jgi:NADPH:quinone reductase-like Zn-dependent oxidoreductase
MRAVSQRRFGGPEVLELVEVERPVAGPGEALVRVRGASVNPGDWKVRSGLLPRFGNPPFTLGLDFSGIVEAVGEPNGGVGPGDAVFGCSLPPKGAYAEYVAARVDWLQNAPAGIDLVQAAALPVTSLTAWQALVKVAEIGPGQRVLVHAASGGIGHLAVQIAKAYGAHVIGTARESKHAFLRELGADQLVDYTEVDFAATIRDVDLVLDPIGEDYGPRSLDTLKPNGLLVDVRGTGPDRSAVRAQAEARGLRFVEFGFTPSGADLQQIAGLVDRGDLRPSVEQVLPLGEAGRAHALSEGGRVRGKLVLAVDGH